MQKHLEYNQQKTAILSTETPEKNAKNVKVTCPQACLFHGQERICFVLSFRCYRAKTVREDLQTDIKLSLFSSQLAETSLSSSKILQEAKRLKKSTYCPRKSNKTCENITENTHVHRTT